MCFFSFAEACPVGLCAFLFDTVCLRVCAFVFLRVLACICVFTCACMCVRSFACACVYLCLYVLSVFACACVSFFCVHLRVFVTGFMSIYKPACVHERTYTHLHMYFTNMCPMKRAQVFPVVLISNGSDGLRATTPVLQSANAHSKVTPHRNSLGPDSLNRQGTPIRQQNTVIPTPKYAHFHTCHGKKRYPIKRRFINTDLSETT